MYRDDTCAVCGESLPPDHFYCREHAAQVDDRLHEIGALLGRVRTDVVRLAQLLGEVAQETWDYLAETTGDDPLWPPVAHLGLRADPEEVDVDVDSEPGLVRVDVRVGLTPLLTAVAAALDDPELMRFEGASSEAAGAGATH